MDLVHPIPFWPCRGIRDPFRWIEPPLHYLYLRGHSDIPHISVLSFPDLYTLYLAESIFSYLTWHLAELLAVQPPRIDALYPLVSES